jgi:ribosomal protein L31E
LKQKKKNDELMVDRLLTINIRKYLVTQPRTKRARKAAKYIKERVAHYTKMKVENVRLGQELNNLIFKEYSRRMVPVKVRVKMGADTADVLPFIEEGAKKEQTVAPAKDAKKGGEKKPLLQITKDQKKKEAPKAPTATNETKKPQQPA